MNKPPPILGKVFVIVRNGRSVRQAALIRRAERCAPNTIRTRVRLQGSRISELVKPHLVFDTREDARAAISESRP